MKSEGIGPRASGADPFSKRLPPPGTDPISNGDFVKTYYEILGVPPDASGEDIRAAYRREIRAVHPDIVPPNRKTLKRTKQLNAALETLSHPESRRKYDQKLNATQLADSDAEVRLDGGWNLDPLSPLASARPRKKSWQFFWSWQTRMERSQALWISVVFVGLSGACILVTIGILMNFEAGQKVAPVNEFANRMAGQKKLPTDPRQTAETILGHPEPTVDSPPSQLQRMPAKPYASGDSPEHEPIHAPIAPELQNGFFPQISDSLRNGEPAHSSDVSTPEPTQQLEKAGSDRLVGEWFHIPGNDFPRRMTVHVSGEMEHHLGVKGHWDLENFSLTWSWLDSAAPDGVWVDRCTLLAQDRIYIGTNQIGSKIFGCREDSNAMTYFLSGGNGGRPFGEIVEPEFVLTGLKVCSESFAGRQCIGAIVPLYRRRSGATQEGQKYGESNHILKTLGDEPGQQVHSLEVYADQYLHGIRIWLVPMDNPNAKPISAGLIGTDRHGEKLILGRNNHEFIGVFGRYGKIIDGLGLVERLIEK